MEHIGPYLNLVINIVTLIFAIGVWKGRKDFSSDELLKKADEVKADLEKYRDRHHKQIEAIQAAIGNLLTKTETDRLMKQHDAEHDRIWKEIDGLNRDIKEVLRVIPLRKDTRRDGT